MIIITEPSTVFIKFTDECPKSFVLTNSDNDNVEYFRFMDGKVPRIKFNIPNAGSYIGNVKFDIVKIVPIEVPILALPTLPIADRNRYRTPKFVFNPNLTDTVARTFSEDGIIEHSPFYESLPRCIQVFIDLHEIGHFFYLNENDADLYAFVCFVRKGYNVSTAYYAMDRVLKKSKQNIERLRDMYNNISNVQYFTP